MSLDATRERILKMHAFSLSISSKTVMGTGKGNVFLKSKSSGSKYREPKCEIE